LFIKGGDDSKFEVSNLVLKSCVLSACKNLQTWNLEPVYESDKLDSKTKMLKIKRIAARHQRKQQEKALSNWVPLIQPLTDMTIEEGLVLEAYL
jgi:hypothetical protein